MAEVPADATTALTLALSCSQDHVQYLGRFRRGDKVPLSCSLASVPDSAPVTVILDEDSATLAAFLLPRSGVTRTEFGLAYRLGESAALGRFQVSHQASVAGVTTTRYQSFDVVAGGDSGGEVIALYSFERPDAVRVVAQLGGGRMVRGDNPRVG